MATDIKRTIGLLSVCAPVYNEEVLVEEFYARATAALVGLDYELIIVNDGSKDGTAEKLDRLAQDDPRLRVVHLSRNFGHQAALTAGLEHARGDAVAMLDADLQDPPELIRQDARGVGARVRRRLHGARAARGRNAPSSSAPPAGSTRCFASSPRSSSSPTRATSACSTAAPSTRCSRWASATASCAG
jgi:glycosyltransferase involved in cell wall biosynthesis